MLVPDTGAGWNGSWPHIHMFEGFLVMAAIALSAESAPMPVIPRVTCAAGAGLADPVATDRIVMAACADQIPVGALERELRLLVVIEYP